MRQPEMVLALFGYLLKITTRGQDTSEIQDAFRDAILAQENIFQILLSQIFEKKGVRTYAGASSEIENISHMTGIPAEDIKDMGHQVLSELYNRDSAGKKTT